MTDEPKTPDIVPVIMAGGFGTRFWPLSTPRRPKQFLHLFQEDSLFSLSAQRALALAPPERCLVMTHRDFRKRAIEEARGIPPGNVIGEPARRDTAPAVALAALIARKRFGNPVMAVLTADHLIEPAEALLRALRSAASKAGETGALYTFGVPPTRPATAYGYLETGERLLDDEGIEHVRLLRFVEKPDAERARAYLDRGTFLWNSGMFVWTADAILDEIARHLPEHLRVLESAANRLDEPDAGETLEKAFENLRPISIDYGVMEKARDVRAVKAPFSWTDVGGWPALEPFLQKDEAGNARRGTLDTLDARDNLVFCEDPNERVALIGVENLVVVRAGTTTLVVPKDRAESIKALVQDG